MNWIDLILIVVVLLSVVMCIQRGFIHATWDLISWLGSLFLGFIGYRFVSGLLLQLFPNFGFWVVPISFVLIIIIARIALDHLAVHLFDLLPQGIHNQMLNKVLGVIPGIVNGLIWATVAASVILFVPLSDQITRAAQSSNLAASFVDKAGWVQDKFDPVFNDAYNRGAIRTSPDKDKSVKLPYTVSDLKTRADLETDMLVLVNKEREKEGLKALKADDELCLVARQHSKDMFARGYFAHINPEGKTPFNRIDAANLSYLSAGENLALAQTLYIAHTGLMKSPGHRANIMNQGFGRLGIGILDGGVYGLMITQVFRN